MAIDARAIAQGDDRSRPFQAFGEFGVGQVETYVSKTVTITKWHAALLLAAITSAMGLGATCTSTDVPILPEPVGSEEQVLGYQPESPPATEDLNAPIAPEPPSDPTQQLLDTLRSLPPLPKVHYSWGNVWSDPRVIKTDDPMLREYIRIAHAIGIAGEWVMPEHITSLVKVCQEVNQGSPGMSATIAINYSPWHRVFPPDAPPTDPDNGEVARYIERMQLIKQWLAEANLELGADIRVSAMLLDSERFFTKDVGSPGAPKWNAAMTAKYDAFYDASKSLFPEVPVQWYARGNGNRHFTLDEKGDTYGSSMYYLPDLVKVYYIFRRTYDQAQLDGVSDIVTWVALGSGYQVNPDRSMTFLFDKEYDTSISWQVGAQLNQTQYSGSGEHFEAVKAISFFPAPFCPLTPAWGRHFVAYVRGANGIPNQP